MDSLSNGSFVAKYNTFDLFDKKPRVIESPVLESTIVQYAIYNHIREHIDNRFIFHSFACRQGKGIHSCKNYVRRYITKHENKFYLQLDIRKYFDSININILKSLIAEYIKDKDLLNLIYKFLEDREKGIPMGNLLSQLFANIYLNKLDWYIKSLGYDYIRYMDDFCIFGLDYKEANILLEHIKTYLLDNLKLEISKYKIGKNKIDFAGYIVSSDRILLRNRHIKSFKKFIKNKDLIKCKSFVGLSQGTFNYKYIKKEIQCLQNTLNIQKHQMNLLR